MRLRNGGFVIGAAILASAGVLSAAPETVDIGSRRELFVDRHLVDRLDGAALVLQRPVDRGPVLRFDAPWEGAFCAYVTVIRDGDFYRAYYRGRRKDRKGGDATEEVTCVAESKDGIAWTKPALGLHEIDGSRSNNVMLTDLPNFTHNFSPFLDARPGVPADERYKAVAGTLKSGLCGFASADGLRWRRFSEAPIATADAFAFDSQNVACWSEAEGRYVCWFRTSSDKIRRISRTDSPDFRTWSAPVRMEYAGGPVEQFYTNQTAPYFRAPHLMISLAARFMPGRRAITAEEERAIGVDPKYAGDCSDAVLMTSRGGAVYDRTFPEGFLRPGVGPENWVSRTNYPALGVVPTGPAEMSFFVNQNYGQPTSHLRRYALRTDGFASVRAGASGGELITKPLTFAGTGLYLNFATSAAGSIRTEIQDAAGKAIPGFALEDSVEFVGNAIDRRAAWRAGADVGTLAGRPVRLRFVLTDADLYAVQFR